MEKRIQKGGRYHVPKPMVHTYPHGVGTARGAAIHNKIKMLIC